MDNVINNKAIPLRKQGRLTFNLLGIPVGAELSFVENDAIKAIVINGINTIRLQDGTETSLSHAVAIIKQKLGTATISEAYQGGVYWLYKGQRLTTIRSQLGR